MEKIAILNRVCLPVEDANGLPNEHYTCPSVFKEEKDILLFNKWSGLAVAAEIPSVGNAVPINFQGTPLFIVRTKENRVKVFQNTCRHRGMILIEQAKSIKGAIRCPYHSWCYSTDGHLISTPHVGGPGRNLHGSIDRSNLGLTEIRSHVWMGVIWINLSGTAPNFEDSMKDLIDRWADFDKPLFHGGSESSFTIEVAANWKLAVENYCESYHLPWVHPGLNTYSRLEDHYHIEHKNIFSGQGTKVYKQLEDNEGNSFPDFPNLTDKWDTAAEYIAVYPNVLLGVHRDHAFAIILIPDGPEKTYEHVHLFYSCKNTSKQLRRKNMKLWKNVFEEDVPVVQGMQRGRHAVKFDGGRFSPVMDSPTHCFHYWVASEIQNGRRQKD